MVRGPLLGRGRWRWIRTAGGAFFFLLLLPAPGNGKGELAAGASHGEKKQTLASERSLGGVVAFGPGPRFSKDRGSVD